MASNDGTEKAYHKITYNILGATEETIGKRRINVNAVNSKPWFTQEVKELATEKDKPT